MTKIDIISGFLGAGKTTLIKKLIKEGFCGEKVVLIENEFGEIGIDGGFLQDAGIEITEMNSGCICCSLVGDFGKALEQVINEYHPDRILIEPSGVGKLSDVILAVENLHNDEIVLNGFTTVVDAKKAKMYMKNFGEFFNNQIEHASAIILSHTSGLAQEKLDACVALLREHNADASIVTTPWENITGAQILDTMEQKNTLAAELEKLEAEAVDPGHFHAALVQNRTYPEVAREVKVFAPDGAELDAHLKLIGSFNTRGDSPTSWKEVVFRGGDYLEAFIAAAKNGELGENPVAVFAGKNDRKGDYALAAARMPPTPTLYMSLSFYPTFAPKEPWLTVSLTLPQSSKSCPNATIFYCAQPRKTRRSTRPLLTALLARSSTTVLLFVLPKDFPFINARLTESSAKRHGRRFLKNSVKITVKWRLCLKRSWPR